MKLDKKFLPFELKLAEDGTRRVSGYGAVFGNVDSYGDIILPGAFAKSLASRGMPKMLAQHDWGKVPGMWDVAKEDEKGLYLEGPFAKTPLGEEYQELAQMGALGGMSIGYRTLDSEYNREGHRLLKEVELWEVSLVTFPANDQATITGVKSSPDNIRDFEKLLREEGGYSREDATTIALHGFKALKSQREAGADAIFAAANRFADSFINLKF